MSQIRVFVVDDSALFRRLLQTTINSIPGVRTVGVAENGEEALKAIAEVKPDLITLDLDMPVMDGLTTLRHLRNHHPGIGVVMVSAFTSEGAAATLQALETGALEVIMKPDTGSESGNSILLREQFSTLLGKFAASILQLTTQSRVGSTVLLDKASAGIPSDHQKIRPAQCPRVIAVGVSTGGPSALGVMLPSLPAGFPVPILIVQHMPRLFTRTLAESLQRKCALEVVEASDNHTVVPGTVYLAPGGRQMKVQRDSDGTPRICITDDPEESHCRPSVNYLFRSVSQVYEHRCTGIIMTGMGSDGVLGLQLMKRRGAFVIAQDEASSTVWSMPRMAWEAGVVDCMLPLEEIGPKLLDIVGLR